MRIQSMIAAFLLAIAALAAPTAATAADGQDGGQNTRDSNERPADAPKDAPAPPKRDGPKAAADYCGPAGSWIGTVVPDSWGWAYFGTACETHDECYSSDSDTDRLSCDRALLSNLRGACYSAYGSWAGTVGCYGAADSYYLAVRKYGDEHYDGPVNS